MMIGAELFRQGPRPRAMSIAGLTNWLFTAVVALSFELVQVRTAYSTEVHNSRRPFDRLRVYDYRRECKGTATLKQPSC